MRMNVAAWKMIHNFSWHEFNEPMKMDQDLLFKLDTMRTWVGRPFIVHASYEAEGHAADSLHPYGKAVDGHFEGLTAIEQYMLAEQFNWGGLGFYPHWNQPGLHLDTRFVPPGEKAARWWRDADGIYQPVDLATISDLLRAA